MFASQVPHRTAIDVHAHVMSLPLRDNLEQNIVYGKRSLRPFSCPTPLFHLPSRHIPTICNQHLGTSQQSSFPMIDLLTLRNSLGECWLQNFTTVNTLHSEWNPTDMMMPFWGFIRRVFTSWTSFHISPIQVPQYAAVNCKRLCTNTLPRDNLGQRIFCLPPTNHLPILVPSPTFPIDVLSPQSTYCPPPFNPNPRIIPLKPSHQTETKFRQFPKRIPRV
jgi:hypothetical protein